MNMKGDMMDDMLASAFDNDEEMEEEAENVTNQVLAELGVELDSQLVGLNAPSKLPSTADQLSKEEQDALDDLIPDLKARLNAL